MRNAFQKDTHAGYVVIPIPSDDIRDPPGTMVYTHFKIEKAKEYYRQQIRDLQHKLEELDDQRA